MILKQPIWPRFLSTATVLGFATLGPIGRKLPAPGTWGSVAGLLYFTVFFHPLGVVGTLIFSAIGMYLAVALCGEAEFRLAKKDPGEVILDEFIAMPLCFLGWRQLAEDFVPEKWAWVIFLVGLGLFRLFDILKPFGIRRLQELPAGWGVVVDDVVAALAACGTMHLTKLGWLAFRASGN